MQKLYEEGLAPKIYGFNEMVRLEQFIESTVLETNQMCDPYYIKKVAINLSLLHSCDIDFIEQNESPIMKIFREKILLLNALSKLENEELFEGEDL